MARGSHARISRRSDEPFRQCGHQSRNRGAGMDVSAVVWWVTILGIVGLLAFDFFFHVRKAHVPTLSEAAVWSAVYVGIALLFGIGVLVFGGASMGAQYF